MLGRIQAEAEAKLKQAIEEAKGRDATRADQYTVGRWMEVWFEQYAKEKVRPSSHQICHGYTSTTNLAKEQKLISANLTEGCALPKLEHKEKKTLPAGQLQSFLR